MNSMSRQQGLGVAGWLLLILVFGGAMTVGMKLLPLYMDHRTMSNVLDSLTEISGLGSQRSDQIQSVIQQRFKLNGIRDFNFKDNMTIARDDDGATVILDYEVRMPLVSNVDLIASFNKEVRVQN